MGPVLSQMRNMRSQSIIHTARFYAVILRVGRRAIHPFVFDQRTRTVLRCVYFLCDQMLCLWRTIPRKSVKTSVCKQPVGL